MRIPRIYTSQSLKPGSQIELEAGPSHHLIKVLRMSEGRDIVLFNGNGCEYPATISQTSKKTAIVAITKEINISRQSPLDIELAIGLSKGDRFELVIQKATELGVTSIVPIFSERTEIKLSGERLDKKMTSWQRIVIGACEQSQRNILPELHAPINIADYISQTEKTTKFVLHHRTDKNLSSYADVTSLSLLIGPEGGLTQDEIDLACANDFAPLALGPRVLRTETAPIAAISIFQTYWGDFR